MQSNPSKNQEVAFVIIYNGVDYYPPTLNAIEILSMQFEKVVVIDLLNYKYGPTVLNRNVIKISVPHRAASTISRARSYFNFLSTVRKSLKKYRPALVHFCDPSAALSVFLSLKSTNVNPILWYHNHDTIEKNQISAFSTRNLMYQMERKILREVDIFSLPAEERKRFFDWQEFKGEYFLVQNYPSKNRFDSTISARPDDKIIKMFFAGRISPGHGFEEIIDILHRKINSKTLQLVLVGKVDEKYKNDLQLRALKAGVTEMLEIHDFIAHSKLASFTAQHQIGLAIYTKNDQMNSTLGTASNKVYEYVACGLPFLYYNNPHFEEHYAGMSWAVATDLSSESLLTGIEKVDRHFADFSAKARHDFFTNRNFESVFLPVVEYAKEKHRQHKIQEA